MLDAFWPVPLQVSFSALSVRKFSAIGVEEDLIFKQMGYLSH